VAHIPSDFYLRDPKVYIGSFPKNLIENISLIF